MNSSRSTTLSPFTVIAFMVLVSTVLIFIRVFIGQNQYAVFTAQSQINAAQQTTFGSLFHFL